jgi:hypothetical protein
MAFPLEGKRLLLIAGMTMSPAIDGLSFLT